MAQKPKQHQKQQPKHDPQQAPLKMKPFGILGGGQLARMLALKCHELGLPTAIYSASADDPAAQVVKDWRKGSLADKRALESFLKSCSVVTFESELMNAELLNDLSKRAGTEIFPSPTLMGALQDRLTQKMLLRHHGVATSPFHNVKDKEAAMIAFDEFKGQVVFKKRRFGYDGNGTFIVRTPVELAHFMPQLSQDEHGFIAEKFIPFKRELAFIAARSRNEDVTRFPFVETLQENSRCLWVKGPVAPSPKLEKIGKSMEKFLKDTEYVGVLGVELFETSTGYLVNELAPRVHNSAHYSLDALTLDQFSAHILSVIGAPLAMMNLLGKGGHEPNWKLPRNVHLHWYGKSENREGRKMGHYNVLASTPNKALEIAKKARAAFDV
jgi:5-(carboxyamino)imidazole ribonucleotide synthase